MLKLNGLFQDGAVLQRRQHIPVWGVTDAECNVSAELDGVVVYGKAGFDGKFMMRFPAHEQGGPFVLTVQNDVTGEKVVVDNVLIGEVWLASGQSNMEYELGANIAVDDVPGVVPVRHIQVAEFRDTIVDNNNNFRYFTVEGNEVWQPESVVLGKWRNLDYNAALGCSAVAAWFGYYLRQELKGMPVGLIVSAVGGSEAEAWISRNGNMQNPFLQEKIEEIDDKQTNKVIWHGKSSQELQDEMMASPYGDKENKGILKHWAELDFDDSQWKDFQVPGSWKKQNVAKNGVLWARKKITIPQEWAGKKLVMSLGGIDKQDITYFNGVEIGRTGKYFDTKYWNKVREYTVPAELVKGGEAVIAVRAYSFMCDGSFNGINTLFELQLAENQKEALPLAGIWKAETEVDFGDVDNILNVKTDLSYIHTATCLFNSMIAPIIPYGMRGVIWYQGESNADTLPNALAYGSVMESLINDWRYLWAQQHMPFFQVELANYHKAAYYDDKQLWPVLREGQQAACKIPESYIATAVDIGNERDIHPQNKKDVGKRLAYNALRNVYGFEKYECEGPRYEYCSCENGVIRLHFSHADGMTFKCNAEEAAKSFYVSGVDRIFVAADDVRIDGADILVSSKQVKNPRAVRYAWSDNPTCVLYNAADFPTSPFRTDDFNI